MHDRIDMKAALQSSMIHGHKHQPRHLPAPDRRSGSWDQGSVSVRPQVPAVIAMQCERNKIQMKKNENEERKDEVIKQITAQIKTQQKQNAATTFIITLRVSDYYSHLAQQIKITKLHFFFLWFSN